MLTEERLASIFMGAIMDSLDNPLFVYSPDETYWLVNGAFAKIFGKMPDDIIGKPLNNLFSPEESEERLNIIRSIFKTGERKETEFRVKNTLGEMRCFKTVFNPVKDDDGEVIFVSCIAIDITERKQAEERLQESIKLTDAILKHAAEGIFGLNLQGETTFVNPAAACILGYTPQELIGKQSHNTWHYKHNDGSSYPIDECPIFSSMHNATVQLGEERFVKKDGSFLTVEFSSTPILDGACVVGAVVIFRDITERKQMEMALIEKERLSAIGEIASGVAHDFNNSLQIISGNLELAMLTIPNIPSEVIKFIELAQASAVTHPKSNDCPSRFII